MGNGGFLLQASGFRSGIRAVGDAIPSDGKANMEIAASHLKGEIKDRSPVDTGHLRASYSHVVETQGKTVIGHVGTNTPYAEHQEMYGTPHIRPAVDANQDRLIKIMAEDTLTGAIGHL